MGWICPECGFLNTEEVAVCSCGFDQSVFPASDPVEAEADDGGELMDSPFGAALAAGDVPPAGRPASTSSNRAVAEKPRTARTSFHTSDRITIREIGSWKFSFSPSEGKISVGTPALDPFRLDLKVGDLEQILETVYEMSGNRKTFRRLELADNDVMELIEFIGEMIDAKRSTIMPPFSQEDMGVIAALVNSKLSQ